jgi:hypothetical protein
MGGVLDAGIAWKLQLLKERIEFEGRMIAEEAINGILGNIPTHTSSIERFAREAAIATGPDRGAAYDLVSGNAESQLRAARQDLADLEGFLADPNRPGAIDEDNRAKLAAMRRRAAALQALVEALAAEGRP